jgi:hypothetical protein
VVVVVAAVFVVAVGVVAVVAVAAVVVIVESTVWRVGATSCAVRLSFV